MMEWFREVKWVIHQPMDEQQQGALSPYRTNGGCSVPETQGWYYKRNQPEVPPRQEWEETYFSLPATHAEQSPFWASHWPNSATDLGVWEMQITGISPHPSTQYRAGMGKEKKCIWEQKSPRLTQKERLCIPSDRSFRTGRKVTGWEKGRLYRCFKKLFKGYVLFIPIIKYWPYFLLYIIHLCRLFYS